VNEGQDYTKKMLKIVSGLLKPETNNMTIALDYTQTIYREKGSPIKGFVKRKNTPLFKKNQFFLTSDLLGF
jgi:hypothetical protein